MLDSKSKGRTAYVSRRQRFVRCSVRCEVTFKFAQASSDRSFTAPTSHAHLQRYLQSLRSERDLGPAPERNNQARKSGTHLVHHTLKAVKRPACHSLRQTLPQWPLCCLEVTAVPQPQSFSCLESSLLLLRFRSFRSKGNLLSASCSAGNSCTARSSNLQDRLQVLSESGEAMAQGDARDFI